MSDSEGCVGQGGVASCQKFDGFTGGEYTGAVGTDALQLFRGDGQGDSPLCASLEADSPEGDQFAVGRGVTVSSVAPPEIDLRDLISVVVSVVFDGDGEPQGIAALADDCIAICEGGV